VTSEELAVDAKLGTALHPLGGRLAKLWGATLFHPSDLQVCFFFRVFKVLVCFYPKNLKTHLSDLQAADRLLQADSLPVLPDYRF
jgi:hypothetical protein